MFRRQQEQDSQQTGAPYSNWPPQSGARDATSRYPTINFDAVPQPHADGSFYNIPMPSQRAAPFPAPPPPAASLQGRLPGEPTAAPPPDAPPVYGQRVTPGQFSHMPVQLHQHSAPKTRRSQNSGQWTPPPPIVQPMQGGPNNKKALIIGCNYKGSQYELQGCIHDARNIEYMLMTKFRFQRANIRVLVDDGSGNDYPTRSSIFAYIRWLMHDVKPGDSLFFHFSGHGSQKPDYSGDERDGLNETLLPCDFRQAGQIIDDEINEQLINPLPRGVYLHAIIDACHSGTAMDLEFYTKLKGGEPEWRSEGPTRTYKGTSGGIAVSFSACRDDEVAQDTDNLSGSVHTGAATHAFIEAVEANGAQLSYREVLLHMHKTMEKLSGKPIITGGLIDKMANKVMKLLGLPQQTPQLSSNVQLNLYETLHI